MGKKTALFDKSKKEQKKKPQCRLLTSDLKQMMETLIDFFVEIMILSLCNHILYVYAIKKVKTILQNISFISFMTKIFIIFMLYWYNKKISISYNLKIQDKFFINWLISKCDLFYFHFAPIFPWSETVEEKGQ